MILQVLLDSMVNTWLSELPNLLTTLFIGVIVYVYINDKKDNKERFNDLTTQLEKLIDSNNTLSKEISNQSTYSLRNKDGIEAITRGCTERHRIWEEKHKDHSDQLNKLFDKVDDLTIDVNFLKGIDNLNKSK